jgi:hypothetical protein
VLSEVATEVPVYRVSADVDVPPDQLADVVESGLGMKASAGAVA